MAKVFYFSDGRIYGVHHGEFSGHLPDGITVLDIPDDFVWPKTGRESEAKVVDGVVIGTLEFRPIPVSVAKLQLVRALRKQGDWNTVRSAIAQADADTKEDWEIAADIKRVDPIVEVLKIALSLTDAEMNDLFVISADL